MVSKYATANFGKGVTETSKSSTVYVFFHVRPKTKQLTLLDGCKIKSYNFEIMKESYVLT